ncbi:MAG: hypothetical protein ACK4HL_19585 [Aestuariivirga sp.]
MGIETKLLVLAASLALSVFLGQEATKADGPGVDLTPETVSTRAVRHCNSLGCWLLPGLLGKLPPAR